MPSKAAFASARSMPPSKPAAHSRMPIGLAGSESTRSIVARLPLGSITARAPSACERGCSARSLRLDHLYQRLLHVAKPEIAHDVDPQGDVPRRVRRQQFASQPGSLLAWLFSEWSSPLLETLLNRSEHFKPLGGRTLLRIRESSQPAGRFRRPYRAMW